MVTARATRTDNQRLRQVSELAITYDCTHVCTKYMLPFEKFQSTQIMMKYHNDKNNEPNHFFNHFVLFCDFKYTLLFINRTKTF